MTLETATARLGAVRTAMAALCAALLLLAAPVPAMSQEAGAPEPACNGGTGSGCWLEIANRPGCYAFSHEPIEGETVTWSGGCADGRPFGHGRETWHWQEDGQDVSGAAEGSYLDGERHGHWVLRLADGGVQQGPVVHGVKHGHWVLRFAGGSVEEGPVVNGKQHGHWVLRGANGEVQEGPFVDGRKHGHWVDRLANGDVGEGPYVHGKRHGRWVVRYANGTVEEGPVVHGKEHGHWILRFPDGNVAEGPYADGVRHGHWILRWPDGTVQEVRFVHGVMQNPSVERSPRYATVEEALSLSRTQRAEVQSVLNALGYDSGAADGIFGPRTRRAIKALQRALGLDPNGYLNAGLLEHLTAIRHQ